MAAGVKMIKDLQENKLEFKRTLDFVFENLANTNILSNYVLNYVDFKSGYFYTLLPENSNKKELYDFYSGGKTKTIRPEVSVLIYELLKKNVDFTCIFDNESESYDPNYNEELFSTNGFHCDNEIYYAINSTEASQELVKTCLYVSNATWHSLCVITKFNITLEGKALPLSQFENICLAAEMLLFGAYDAEAFVFWKKL